MSDVVFGFKTQHFTALSGEGKGKKGKAVPLHAMEALGGEEI